MKIPSSALPWIIGAATAFFAGVLVFGLYQGTLLVPAKGFQTTLQRDSNPLGFYVLAAFYAALMGACGYLLWAVLTADRRPASGLPMRKPVAHRGQSSEGPVGRFEITQEGRGGNVIARLQSGSHAFWWEFGGGNCVAFIAVPTAEQWRDIPALAPHPRGEFLQAMADDVGRRQCPGARAIIGADSIVFEA